MKSVVIIGVGALGSHVAMLGRNWPNALVLVDFDRIEQKNVLSQFHTVMGLGRNKAQALQQALQGMFKVKTAANPNRLTKDNADTLLGNAALILDCTDNAEARRLIQGVAKAKGIPCLHGALAATGDFARIVWTEHFTADEEGAPGQATCEDGENLPFHALAASHIAMVAQRFLKTGERQSFQVTAKSVVRLA